MARISSLAMVSAPTRLSRWRFRLLTMDYMVRGYSASIIPNEKLSFNAIREN